MIEDMYGTKHLPGLSEGPMTPIPEFVEKIKAAVDARKGELVLIARSDALSAKEPFEKGTPELREATGRPVMTVTMPTDPDSAPGVLEASGVKIACYAYQVMAVAIGAVQRALRDIHETGRIQSYEQLAVSSEDYRKILGTDGAVMVRDRELDDEFLRRAREQGVFQASALAIQALPVDSGWLRDPAFREATPASVIARLESGETGRPGGSSAERTQQFKDLMRKNVQKLRSAGVPIALGGDTGIPTRFVGYNEHLELQAMVAVGMSPLEAISAGTSVAAAILRLQDLGSLTPGKSADFIVLDGNPLESIVNTTRIASVYRDGKPVDRDSLKAGWMR